MIPLEALALESVSVPLAPIVNVFFEAIEAESRCDVVLPITQVVVPVHVQDSSVAYALVVDEIALVESAVVTVLSATALAYIFALQPEAFVHVPLFPLLHGSEFDLFRVNLRVHSL